jgi:hypothetical protein
MSQPLPSGRDPVQRIDRLGNVIRAFGDETCDRAAMSGDDDLFPLLHPIEQLGQARFGIVGTDGAKGRRDGFIQRSFLDQSADRFKHAVRRSVARHQTPC